MNEPKTAKSGEMPEVKTYEATLESVRQESEERAERIRKRVASYRRRRSNRPSKSEEAK